MRVVYPRCAGLDVHKKTVSVCIRSGKGKKTESKTGVFGTFTSDLHRMRDFLGRHKAYRVVMESTGVYWVPVWNVLERARWKAQDLVLVNPQHVRALPGRKTDEQDCERLAELGQYNLLRGSFVPPRNIRELRDLTRARARLQGDRNRVINRIGRLLEMANVKLGSVVSDIKGKTGWLILKAIVNGITSPNQLAELAQGKLKSKRAELVEALEGYITDHFRWMLGELVEELERLDEKLDRLEERIREAMKPYAEAIRRLCTIPTVKETTAWTMIAELGTDMTCFPDAAHAASWAGLCPGNQESAGKRQSGRTRKGNRYLRRALIQNGWAAARMTKKDCFLTGLFYRVALRRGMQRAVLAVAHRVLVIAYHVLRDGAVYHEIGRDYLDRQHPQRAVRRLSERLERMGYGVQLTRLDPPEPKGKLQSQKRTTAWKSELLPVPRGPAEKRPPATPEECVKCARWGIACIHLRGAKTARGKKAAQVDSAG